MADRLARERTPITDGAYGKPWVYRYKDLVELVVAAALQPDRRRRGLAPADGLDAALEADLVHGARLPRRRQGAEPAQRLSRSEIGGKRLALFLQRRTVGSRTGAVSRGALRRYWDPDDEAFRCGPNNPDSPLYGGRMVDHSRVSTSGPGMRGPIRPFPCAPINGQTTPTGIRPLAERRVSAIRRRRTDQRYPGRSWAAAADMAKAPTERCRAMSSTSRRLGAPALEPIIDLFGLGRSEDRDGLTFAGRRRQHCSAVDVDRAGLGRQEPGRRDGRARPITSCRSMAVLGFSRPDARVPDGDGRAEGASARRAAARRRPAFPALLEAGQAHALLGDWLRRKWSERETISFSVAQPQCRHRTRRD